jgi:hypothetical protein
MTNRETYLQFSAAWEAKDLDVLMTLLTDDVIYSASIGPEPGTTYRGKAAVRAGIAAIIAHDAATKIEITELYADGDRLFPLWRYTLPDGSFAMGMDVISLRDGLICRKDGYRKLKPNTTLAMKSACERCNAALPQESETAHICSYECTFCAACAEGPLARRCPNCGGVLRPRPSRL